MSIFKPKTMTDWIGKDKGMKQKDVKLKAEELAWHNYHDLLTNLDFKRIPEARREVFLKHWLSEMRYRIKHQNGWHRDEKDRHKTNPNNPTSGFGSGS